EGLHPGGDGLVRELEALSPALASLLAAHRPAGAAGLAGGGRGAPGAAALRRGGAWAPWSGEPAPLAPGDRVRVCSPGGGGWGAPSPRATP
ncbi:MAG: hydantoinase B/oxoprolinase family protein, partial [Deltaproteobacteria bacterium]|nr:hydantoinase B/oxoprolinase family protein [Deltaproteobacteria bacterium]